MEKKAEKEKTDMGQKRKALQDELMAAKKKTELESVASWLLDTANKKAKEAEKKSGVAAMKALIMESSASQVEQKKWRERTLQPKQETRASKKETQELFMCGMINLGKYYELTKKGSLF